MYSSLLDVARRRSPLLDLQHRHYQPSLLYFMSKDNDEPKAHFVILFSCRFFLLLPPDSLRPDPLDPMDDFTISEAKSKLDMLRRYILHTFTQIVNPNEMEDVRSTYMYTARSDTPDVSLSLTWSASKPHTYTGYDAHIPPRLDIATFLFYSVMS